MEELVDLYVEPILHSMQEPTAEEDDARSSSLVILHSQLPALPS